MWTKSLNPKLSAWKHTKLCKLSYRHLSQSVTNSFHGVWPIIATPFNDDERIDHKSFEKIINFYSNEVGVNGCTIIGVLGESNRLTDGERVELIKIATSISSKPICVGTSHSGTYATAKLSQQAMNNGAHSVMITPSREAIPGQDKYINYYTKIYNHLGNDIPIVLQDHPASTLCHMTLDTIKAIITQCKSVQCVKLESLPSPPKIRKLIPYIQENQLNCTILTGLGALYGLFDLECNSNGFMTGFAFPEALYELYKLQILEKDNETAKLLYQQWLPLFVFEQQPGIAMRKEIYKLRNLIDSTYVRHPGSNATNDAIKQLKDWIQFVIGNNVDLTKRLNIDSNKLYKSKLSEMDNN